MSILSILSKVREASEACAAHQRQAGVALHRRARKRPAHEQRGGEEGEVDEHRGGLRGDRRHEGHDGHHGPATAGAR